MSQTKIQGSFLTDNTVGVGKLEDGAVTSPKIAASTIAANNVSSAIATTGKAIAMAVVFG